MSEQLHVTTSDATTKTCKIIQRWLSCQYDCTAKVHSHCGPPFIKAPLLQMKNWSYKRGGLS